MRYLIFLVLLSLFTSCQKEVTGLQYSQPTGSCTYDELIAGWEVTVIPTEISWTPCDNAFANGNKGVIVGTEGVILYSDNGGMDWTPAANDVLPHNWKGVQLDFVEFPDPQTIYTGNVGRSALLKSVDGGQSFEELAVPHGTRGIADIVFFDKQRGLLLTNGGGYRPRGEAVLQTADGGQTWTPVQLPGHVNGLGARIYGGFEQAYIGARDTASLDGLLHYTPSSGLAYRPLPVASRGEQRLHHVRVIDELHVAAYTEDWLSGWLYTPSDFLYISGNQGVDWQERMNIRPDEMLRQHFDTPQAGIIFTHSKEDLNAEETTTSADDTELYRLYQTTDGGHHWTERVHPLSCELRGPIAAPGPGSFVMANRGTILVFERR